MHTLPPPPPAPADEDEGHAHPTHLLHAEQGGQGGGAHQALGIVQHQEGRRAARLGGDKACMWCAVSLVISQRAGQPGLGGGSLHVVRPHFVSWW